ncbi:granulin b [Genypterus blacodes]|uniref:granulin b n=1 Tax=Genypterus blacodes TaxID=154954 RepID=UPI003F761BCC
MMMQVGILCVALLGLSTALICPDGGMCEERNTCCKNPSGGYGCCPLPNAECCSDHLHCCYEGTVCDLEHSRCLNKTVSLPWVMRLPAQQLRDGVKAVVCPDQEYECPDLTTCCQIPDSSWGCCPLPKAVCCEDKLHCCPNGTKCDLLHSKCQSATSETFPMLEKVPARKRKDSNVRSVTCPGGKSSCPDSYTCCLQNNGEYGCCPFPKAVCCSDHQHCCPDKTMCDLDRGVCKSGDTEFPLQKKIASLPKDVQCPDKKSSCPDQTTCCHMANGTYGCCPMPDAVCCSDELHCCPAGTTCDLTHDTCVSARGEMTMAFKVAHAGMQLLEKQTAAQSNMDLIGNAVPCNDTVACSDGYTCCTTLMGQWACCPLQEAVCCEDHAHCCPHGTVCNLEASTCDDSLGNAVMPWLDKVPVISILPNKTKCDESISCPGQSTCCKTAGGDWACCPLHKAVCCDDHLHCCPHDTVCNLETETCDDPAGLLLSLPWVAKVSALPAEGQDEKCDMQTLCPGGTTCCKISSDQWACCPLPQAVCCDDLEHCCPKGYKCNVAGQTCDKPGSLSLPWVHKVPTLHRVPTQTDASISQGAKNTCDPHTSCPQDSTCCFMNKARRWGCCPVPEAVCCKDGDHCCPSGHTCDPHRSSCSKGHRVIPWYTKQSALTEPGTVTDVKCDDKTSCASGATCCKLETGGWGCCPLVKAVCCADLEHCCPQGYTCNMQTETCEKKLHGLFLHSLPLSTVVQPEQREAREDEDVPCGQAGEFRCSKRDTCCKTSATEWACCPSPNAVCCADSKHCCPAGYSCDLQAGGCTQQSQPLTWDSFFGGSERKTRSPLDL